MAKVTEGPKRKNSNQNVDFYDEASLHIEGLALGFRRNLVANTDRRSHLAYKICETVEAREATGCTELSEDFPLARRNYKRRFAAARKERAPFKIEKTKLQEHISLLKDSAGIGLTDIREGKPRPLPYKVQRQIDKLSRRIAELDIEIDRIKLPRIYRKRYDVETFKPGVSEVPAHDWAYMQDWFAKEEKDLQDAPKLPMLEHLRELGDYLRLDPIGIQLATLLYCYHSDSNFENFIDHFSQQKQKGVHVILSRMLGTDPTKISDLLRADGPLVANGIVTPGDEDDMPYLSKGLISILAEQNISFEQIVKRLIGEPVTTDLDWDENFSHLGTPGEEMIKIIRGAREEQQAGINILLYGLQDAGKTEGVKAACKKLGLTLYSVGEKDKESKEPSRGDRIAQALLAQSLLADQPNAAILFDEMEDALPQSGIMSNVIGGPQSAASKIFLNRMLEKNKTITFWTANDAEKFHPAIRRRMRFSIEFRVPPAKVREHMWQTIGAKHAFALSAEDCRQLGHTYVAPPGMITTAIRNAKLSGGGVPSIETSLRASAKLVFGSRRAVEVRDELPSFYDLALINATIDDESLDVQGLTKELVESPYRNISILLYGPSGTGKSAYPTHLADLLGLEVLRKKVSDLFSPYHGETEQKIAAAFAEAEETNRFLIFDEGDSLLKDRTKVEYSWQIPMINQMLTSIEHHPLPFACTTNLVDDLDPASKRRFLFKMKYDYMKPEQAMRAFRLFFKQEPPPELAAMRHLASGDFANVAQQLKIRNRSPSPEILVTMLAREVKQKNDARKNVIKGFGDDYAGPYLDLKLREGLRDARSSQAAFSPLPV